VALTKNNKMKSQDKQAEEQAKVDILQEIFDEISDNPQKKEFTVRLCDVFENDNKKLNTKAMTESGYYPEGAEHDSRAPYNEPDPTDKREVVWEDITVFDPDGHKNINVLFKLHKKETGEEIEIHVLNYKYPVFYTNWPEDIEIFYEIETAKKVKCYTDFKLTK